ncbi:unnamed protein product [Adineta steineri]|nr:unnamed protein product [Adineta steineri]CAF1129272.1 unnamed protein product [Adineta steineri]CAF1271381.1 unnamed protein product [Adineta steineri]CAF3718258.1 unnamed protein product [Adineta steineri]CAF3776080.1 unnamed protein product [Adineta steineri]
MFFDRESTIVITKINNLSESVLTAYCQNFGKVLRCYIKNSSQSPKKDPYALIKFSDASSVVNILNHRHHTINGTHVGIRGYHEDRSKPPSTQSSSSNLMPVNQQNQNLPNNTQPSMHYDQLIQENSALKYEIASLQKSLAEAQAYSKTAYDTFQILREKFEAEQAHTNQLKVEYTAMVESYESRLKQISSTPLTEQDKVKDEPIDCNARQMNVANHLLEMQTVKDCLEQAQIDLGKCQTENAILNAKLNSREQQFDIRFKELNNQYLHMKKQYEHMSSCIKDFHSKLYQKKRIKTELKEDISNKTNDTAMDDSSDDVIEIITQVEPSVPYV